MSEVLMPQSGVPTAIDRAEAAMIDLPRVEVIVTNALHGGFYIRQCRMPSGAIIASKIHRHRHSFHVTQGRCTVFNELGKVVEEIAAPYVGITEPGTRRLLLIEEETVWTTFHPVGELQTLEEIEAFVIEPHINPILGIPHAMLQHINNTAVLTDKEET